VMTSPVPLRRALDIYGHTPPLGACYLSRLAPPKVLFEEVTGCSSAAIVATKPGLRAKLDAIIGQFQPTACR
jgi:hypothetical protein